MQLTINPGPNHAGATLDTLGPFDSAVAGLDLHFAALVFAHGEFTFGSNAARVSPTQ